MPGRSLAQTPGATMVTAAVMLFTVPSGGFARASRLFPAC
jgi:hypothetical protein